MLLITLSAKSQEYNYYHYDTKDGLSGTTVYSIAQDKDGFLWFGTEAGLSRYDGSHFVNYTVNDGLTATEIISLFVDSKNRVWIFPFKSSIYYYYQGKIHNTSNDSLLNNIDLRDEIFKAREDKDGNIFFIEQKKIHILSADDKFSEITKFNNQDFDTNDCGIDPDGFFTLYVNDPKTEFSIYKYKKKAFHLQKVFFDSSFTRHSLEINPKYSITKHKNQFQIYSQIINSSFKLDIPVRFYTMSYISDSTFAISTFDKTLLFNINTQTYTDSFLIGKVVNRCFKDRENNIWFATSTQGLYQLSSTKLKVYRFADNMNFSPVYALKEINGKLFIGSSKNYLWSSDFQNNKLQKIEISNKYLITRISQIKNVGNKELYLGSNTGLFRIINNKTTVYCKDVAVKNFFMTDSFGVVASSRAVYKFSFKDSSSHPYFDTIWNSRATCVNIINSKYYVGTLRGLYLVNKDLKTAPTDMGKLFSCLSDKIISIDTISGNDAWVATESNGLAYIKNDKVIYQVTAKDGLLGRLCKCVYLNGKNLWVGTDQGVSKIDISSYPFIIKNFTIPEANNLDNINCIYTKGDSVFVGTSFGLSLFADTITQGNSSCSLKLLEIKSKYNDWYFKQNNMYLSSSDGFLRFEYTGISFTPQEDITYYYQLKGLSDEWQSTKQNAVDFQSLDPGIYQFNIYAINKYGEKSKTITVDFTKEKPFWQLLWVQILILIFIGSIIWLLVQLRIKAVRKNANEKLLRERKINELEQLAFRAQMNPHFIFNSLNSIQQYVFSGNVMEANEFITNFSSLVRQTLYISGKKFITLEEEIKYLDTYLQIEKTKYEDIFDFEIICVNTDKDIPVPPMLIQPFVENSIRHGVLNLMKNKGKICIRFFEQDDSLCCIIEDNGIGRQKSLQLKTKANAGHQSKGMELVQKRIDSLNSIYNCVIIITIEDINEWGVTGTRVLIKLPLSYYE